MLSLFSAAFSQLAEGLEKYRNDSCINIWNIHHKPGNELGDRQRYSSSHIESSGAIHTPYVEIGGKLLHTQYTEMGVSHYTHN